MAASTNIRTYFNGEWHDGNVPIMKAADHAAWLGSSVFDGARYFDGVSPDLDKHCARANASAEALLMAATVPADQMVEIALEGLKGFAPDAAVYIRPMYWATDGDQTMIAPSPEATQFALCLEEIAMAPEAASATLTRTRFRRPLLESSVVNAKAGCLYPNNARMLREARAKGFTNTLTCDAMGNVAETATSNVFMVKDGEVFTPIANGTFLSGITRARHIANMRAEGIVVHEAVLSYAHFEAADEIFLSGNMSKVTPVTAFDEVSYQHGPVTKRVREIYWDWAKSAA
ncbi:branched-chain amino acid aminotransferase [Arenibacterium sp. LLYu02]|uniref:branched-chain amino acid aminotransferase n=1 Tax=Arenibacterium sp. LLYu02 TaxID=3404132 RepID=UPI003B210D9E